MNVESLGLIANIKTYLYNSRFQNKYSELNVRTTAKQPFPRNQVEY